MSMCGQPLSKLFLEQEVIVEVESRGPSLGPEYTGIPRRTVHFARPPLDITGNSVQYPGLHPCQLTTSPTRGLSEKLGVT